MMKIIYSFIIKTSQKIQVNSQMKEVNKMTMKEGAYHPPGTSNMPLSGFSSGPCPFGVYGGFVM
jgi:hypothetical protein